MAKFIFCFPYRDVGGVPILFARLARALAQSGNHEASVVDYADGTMAALTRSTPVELIEYRDDAPCPLPADAIVIFQTLRPWTLYSSLQFHGETRLYFWTCHPFNLVPTLPGLRKLMMSNERIGRAVLATILRPYRTIMLRFIALLLERRALAFADRATLDNTVEYLGIDIPDPDLLPVCAENPPPPFHRIPRDWRKDGLRLAWLGRLGDFKHSILTATMSRLERIQTALDVPIRFTIVGNGEYEHLVRAQAQAMSRVTVVFVDHLDPDAIPPFLLDQVDVLCAMGTSALEGIRLGIPTILLDFTYGAVPDGYIYRWLHQRTGYRLGDVIGAAHIEPGNDSLRRQLMDVMNDFETISAAARLHFETSHALSAVMNRLITLTEASRCFHRDYVRAGFTEPDRLYERFASLRRKLARS